MQYRVIVITDPHTQTLAARLLQTRTHTGPITIHCTANCLVRSCNEPAIITRCSLLTVTPNFVNQYYALLFHFKERLNIK